MQDYCNRAGGFHSLAAYRRKCLLGVSAFVLSMVPMMALAQQIWVVSEDRVIDNDTAHAHTTGDHGASDAPAVYVNSGTLTVTNSDIEFISDGSGAMGMLVESSTGSTVATAATIIGAEGKTARIVANGDLGASSTGAGVVLSGDVASIYLENLEIVGAGAGTRGITTFGGSELTVVNSTIQSNGIGIYMRGNDPLVSSKFPQTTLTNTSIETRNGNGISMANGGTLNADGFDIKAGLDVRDGLATETGNSLGVTAFNSTITLKNGNIETWDGSGVSSYTTGTFNAANSVSLSLENVNFVTHGTADYGIVLDGMNATIVGGSIHTHGTRSIGVSSISSGPSSSAFDLTLTDTKITTDGDYAMGIYVYALENTVVEAKHVTVETSGDTAYGVAVSSSSLALSAGSSVVTTGNNAGAVVVGYGSHVSISDSSVKTTGQNASAIHLTGYYEKTSGTNYADANSVDVTNSTIETAQGPALRVTSGYSNVFNLSHTRVSAQDGGGTLFLSEALDALTPLEVGTANVNADASFVAGDVVVESGVVSFDLSNGSLWKGATNAGAAGLMLDHLAIDATSGWEVRASSTLNDLENAGTLSFATPTNDDFKVLTIAGDYTGNDGLIVFNTVLGDDSSKTDRLIIEGLVSGTSRVGVTNAGGLGAMTTGDGILLIDAAQASTDAFTQADRIAAGAYDYTLFAGDQSGSYDGKWYLRSTYQPDEPDGDDTSDEPDGDDRPVKPELPDYRREVPLYMAAAALANHYGLASLGTYHDRRDASDIAGSAFWFRAFGEGGSVNKGGRGATGQLRDFNDFGASYDYRLGGFQAGADLYRHDDANGAGDVVGLYAGAGRAEADVDRVYGGDAGDASLNAYSVGGYWTHIDPRGWYTDAVVQATRYDGVEGVSTDNTSMRTAGWGFVSSLEGGYSFAFHDGWTIEPQAQLIYQHISLDDGADRYGRVSFADNDTVHARIGARVGKEWQTAKGEVYSFWGRANLWRSAGGKAETTFSNLDGANALTFSSDQDSPWGADRSGSVGPFLGKGFRLCQRRL